MEESQAQLRKAEDSHSAEIKSHAQSFEALQTRSEALAAELAQYKGSSKQTATELDTLRNETQRLTEELQESQQKTADALLSQKEEMAAESLQSNQSALESTAEVQALRVVIDNLKVEHETTRAELAVAMSGGVQKVWHATISSATKVIPRGPGII